MIFLRLAITFVVLTLLVFAVALCRVIADANRRIERMDEERHR